MATKIEKQVCLAGKNDIAVYGLSLLLKLINKENLSVICNETDDGFDSWQPSLLKAAKDNDVSLTTIEDCYDIDGLIFLSLEFDKIISPDKFINASLFNIHFSNLPAYKGMYTSALPLLNDEKESGVTLHYIDSGIDTGDIIDQLTFPIDRTDTARNLYEKYLLNSKKLLDKNLSNLIKGELVSHSQSAIGSTYFSKKSIDYKNLQVNLSCSANQIFNQIRAFTFPEYQVPRVHGFFVNSVKILDRKSSFKSGTLLRESELEICISSMDYDLILYRDMNAELFLAAAENNKPKILSCLENGADINLRNGKGWTPLIVASFNGGLEAMKTLIENGADIDMPDFKGITPLMYAMQNYEKTKLKLGFDLLLEKGANKKLRDGYNLSIEDHAKLRKVFGLLS